MAVDLIQMATCLGASIVIPVVLLRGIKWPKLATFVVSLLAANLVTHWMPRIIDPSMRYGSTYGVAIGMYAFMTLFVVGLTVAAVPRR